MNTLKTLAAVLVTVATTGAMAQEATLDTWTQSAKSVVSRQAVHNDAVAARVAGTIEFGEASGRNFTRSFQPQLTRAQVVAEATEARRLGLVQDGEVQRVATPRELAAIARAGSMAVNTNTNVAGR